MWCLGDGHLEREVYNGVDRVKGRRSRVYDGDVSGS